MFSGRYTYLIPVLADPKKLVQALDTLRDLKSFPSPDAVNTTAGLQLPKYVSAFGSLDLPWKPFYKDFTFERPETFLLGFHTAYMTPEEAYQEALRRIREAEETGATALDLRFLDSLNQLPLELEHLTSVQSLDLYHCEHLRARKKISVTGEGLVVE